MLVIFKSPAGADIMMFEENAKQILDLLGKDIHKGIITSDETGTAIATLEKEIERKKQIEAEEKAKEKNGKKKNAKEKKRKEMGIPAKKTKKHSLKRSLLSVFPHVPIRFFSC